MRFSIRTLLFVILLTALGCVYYVYIQPLRIPIAGEMKLEPGHKVPPYALCYRGRWQVYKALSQWDDVSWREDRKDPGFNERYRILKQNLNRFQENWDFRETDNAVVETHKDVFVKLALARLDDARPLEDVSAAYRVLCKLGHSHEAIRYLTGRYLKHSFGDSTNLSDWPFAETAVSAEDGKHFAQNNEFIAELVSLAESSDTNDQGNALPWRYFQLLAKAGRPDLGMNRHTALCKANTGRCYTAGVMRWAKENNALLSDHIVELALKECEDVNLKPSQRLRLARSLGELLTVSHPDRTGELKSIILKIRKSLPPGDPSALEAIPAEPANADYFRSQLSESKWPKEKWVAIKKLKTLGYDTEVAPAVVQLVESRELDDKLYEEYAEILGDDAVPFFKTRISELIEEQETEFDLLTISSAIGLLGKLKRGTKDPDTIDFLRDAFERIIHPDGRPVYSVYSRALFTVDALDEIGDQTDDLWNRLPDADSEVEAMALHWILNPDLAIEDLVAQLNTGFNLHRPLKAEDFSEERYHYWHLFGLLEKTGGTKLLDIFDYSLHSTSLMVYDICQLAKDDLKFQAVVQNGLELNIVLNNRLYVVQLTDHGSPLESNAMVDVLNAIIANEGETKRFFVYSSGDSAYLSYIVFVAPVVVENLETKFGIKAVHGYEYYLKH